MLLLLYVTTAAAVLWLVHRFVRPLSIAASVVLIALPFTLVGSALITGGVYGPVDHIYQYAPWAEMARDFGIGPARNASAVDIWSEFFPWRLALRESLARGEWPLWNAYNLAGHPLAAEVQSAPYSPFTLIACLLPASVSQTYSLAIAFFLAGLCAFLFARELECDEGPSLVAAAGWALAASAGARMTAMGFTTVYAPLLLAATRRVIHERTIRSGVILMITLVLQMLAGHPESFFLNVLVGCIYAVFELVRRRAAPWRAMAIGVAAGIVTLLLCAIYILPLLEAMAQSHEYLVKRDALAEVKHGLSRQHVLASLATNAFPHLHVRYWQNPSLGYIGAEVTPIGSILLALAIYAVWRRRSAETWFFAGLAVFCLLTGARWGPIADTLHEMPLLNITLHDRLAFHGAICLIVLATLGVQHLLDTRDRRGVLFTMIPLLVFLAAGIWWIERNQMVATTPADFGRYRVEAELLFLAAAALLIAIRPRALLPPLLALIVAQRALSELDTFETYRPEAVNPPVPILEPLKTIREPFRVVGRGLALPPAMNTFYGIEDVRGYEALTLGQFVTTWKLWSRIHGIWFNRVDDLTAPILSLMNVRFAVQEAALDVPPGWRVLARQPGAVLLENDAVIDRVFVPQRVVLTGGAAEEIVDRMAAVPDFRTIAWITARGEDGERENGPGRITLREYSRKGEYVFDADMQGDGFVVVSSASWKGWQGYVDGKRVPLHRANAAFLGIRVPQGTHSVRLIYWPRSFVQGRAISFATLAVLIAWAIFTATARRSRRTRSARRSSASSC